VPPFDTQSPEELYGELRPLLLRYAAKRFGIPEEIAEELVQDVFVSYVSRHAAVNDARAWLIGAVSHACRHYRRKNERHAPWEEADAARLTTQPDELLRTTVRDALARLEARDARMLWLRLAEGYTVPELARKLGLSRSRTEKLLRRAQQRLEEKLAPAEPSDETASWLQWMTARLIDAYARLCRLLSPRHSSIQR